MSQSVRETAIRAAMAALGVEGSPASGVFRSRLEQVDQTELPCYDVSPGKEEVTDPGEFGDRVSVTRTLTLMVRAVVDAAVQEGSATVDDSALDAFYVFAVQQLTGNSANLGGAVINITERGSEPVFQPFGRDIIGLEMTFELQFATKRGNPAQEG